MARKIKQNQSQVPYKDARRFLNVVLHQIEVWPSVVIQGDDLAVNNCIFGKFAERFIDQWYCRLIGKRSPIGFSPVCRRPVRIGGLSGATRFTIRLRRWRSGNCVQLCCGSDWREEPHNPPSNMPMLMKTSLVTKVRRYGTNL